MADRNIVNIILFNGQAIYAKSLFEPETKDLSGKPLDKPSYSINVRFPKTKAHWYEEPDLKPLVEACKVIMTRDMPTTPFERVEFPVKDGDIPNKKNKVPEWAKGHWTFRASTTYVPVVEQRVGGVVSQLPALNIGGKRLWGDGDHVCVALGVAKRLTDSVGIRAYLNSVLFTAKGPELNLGSGSTDWAEALRLAEEQGIEVKADAGGFNPNAGFPGAGATAGGFNPGAGAGGFNPGAGAFNPGAPNDKPSGW